MQTRNDFLQFSLVCLPIVALNLTMIWFSVHRIPPVPSVEGSLANPAGLITSNFVYDGWGNIENMVTSSTFLLVVFLYYPGVLRLLSAYLLPLVAIAIGGLAELTSVSTVYLTPTICGGGCSFYGMSAISNGVIGFTISSFLTCFVLMLLKSRGRLCVSPTVPFGTTGLRNKLGLVCAFAFYLVLLLVFAGLIALPTLHSQSASVTGGPSPPAILTQTPPVWAVHSASLAYGIVLSVAVFAMVNRRYRFYLPAGSKTETTKLLSNS